ncbi:hypothetical protein CO674_34720 [Rhizobium hidalgonense]|uniref:Transposase DDE domain-containing protein n=1 Tax=Rhizobium hidalgonense TaxID=1538159 RepID=A0ABX4JGR5_9HYPH|nr:hypothetical protein CO674_34720 [Rhizobium hidalgonense]
MSGIWGQAAWCRLGPPVPSAPAGHLPHKGAIGWALGFPVYNTARLFRRICASVSEGRSVRLLPISPRAGEMPGKAEGGSTGCDAPCLPTR